MDSESECFKSMQVGLGDLESLGLFWVPTQRDCSECFL